MKNKTMKFSAVLVATSILFGIAASGDSDGKAQFGKIMNTDYVVTQEVDSVFKSWTNGASVAFTADTANFWIGGKTLKQMFDSELDPVFNRFQTSNYSIFLGNSAHAGNRGLAIGVPYEANWTYPFAGETRASDYSVALGDSAKALHIVSVAIGNQAVVGSLHTTTNGVQEYSLNLIDVTTTISNNVEKTSTNYYAGTVSYSADPQLYERFPRGDTETKFPYRPVIGQKVSGPTTNVNGSVTTITTRYEQKVYSIKDPSFVEPEYWDMYDRWIYGGQGDQLLKNAIYGVAVGSRAYVFGYHSVAYGHYAHAIMPFSSAIGSESHVYSEGSQAFGYDTDISKTSPYSLAIGANASVDAGLTNAIVIGVPQVVDFTNLAYRSKEGMVRDRPKAVKSNSINFAYHGNGIHDFFLDGVSLSDRLASEVKVVGNTKNGTNADVIDRSIREIGNIPDDEEPLVFYSGNGGIYFFTKEYEEDSEANIGDISKIFINGKSLSEIIEGSSSHDADFVAYKTSVSNAAEVAINAINVSTNMTDVKSALTNFFNTIKQ